MIIIPTFQDRSSRYEFDIELNGSIFHLKFHFNARESFWYMDIQDKDEVDILRGIKLVPEYRIIEQHNYIENLPDGEFYLLDTESDTGIGEVTFDNFGSRYQLIFFTSEEIEGA